MRGSSTDTAGSKRSTPPPQSPLLPRAPRNRRTSALACVVRYDALCRSLSNFEIELNREPLKHKMYTLQQQFEQQRQAQLLLPSGLLHRSTVSRTPQLSSPIRPPCLHVSTGSARASCPRSRTEGSCPFPRCPTAVLPSTPPFRYSSERHGMAAHTMSANRSGAAQPRWCILHTRFRSTALITAGGRQGNVDSALRVRPSAPVDLAFAAFSIVQRLGRAFKGLCVRVRLCVCVSVCVCVCVGRWKGLWLRCVRSCWQRSRRTMR
jgi:hypothetical protein